MDRISSPVLPCASRESITDLDIMKKESVMNCVLSEGAPSSLILAVVLVPGAVPSLYSCDRSLCYLVVEHVTVDFDHIYLGVIITNPITSYCIRTHAITEGLIITTLTCQVIQTLIIADPQCNIPGLIIRPTVIGGVLNVGLESGGHLEKSLVGKV